MVEERVQGMKGTENRGKSEVESESKKTNESCWRMRTPGHKIEGEQRN